MNAEEAILGCMLNDLIIAKECAAKLFANDFIDPVNRKIFEGIITDLDNNLIPDVITVSRHVPGKEIEIMTLASQISSTVNYMAYLQSVIEDSSLRQIHDFGPELVAAYDSEEILTSMSKLNDDIQARKIDLINYSSEETIQRTLKEYEEREKGKIPGINTPLQKLTMFTGGWQPSDLIIIAARPSIGKTAFALCCADEALRYGRSVLFFSLEMSRERLMDRLLIGSSGCDAMRYKSGKLYQEERNNVYDIATGIAAKNLHIIDRGGMGIDEISAFALAKHREGKCDIIFVDYLQLIKSRHDRNKTRDSELSEISRGLKLLAKELNVPVIALSQLNREVEKRTDKHPILADLRESGAIEQDADLVLMLFRAAYYGIETVDIGNETVSSAGVGEVIIAKHRNGETGIDYFRHNDTMTRIFNYNSPTF